MKREGVTIDASGDKGRWMISHSALVACEKQNSQRLCLGIALGHGGTSLAAPEPATSPGFQHPGRQGDAEVREDGELTEQ